MRLDTIHPSARIRARRALRGRIDTIDGVAPLPFAGALDDNRGDQMMHRGLFALNRRRMKPGMVSESTLEFRESLRELATIQYFESRILEGARHAVGGHAAEAPRDAAGLLTWLEGLRVTGPGQLDPLWSWIATEASETELHWFVQQELLAEIGTLELVAQVLGPKANLDVLDRLRQMAMLLGVELPSDAAEDEDLTWEAMARSNIVTALASNRRYHAQAVGALAAMMMIQPARLALIDCALVRLGYEVYPPSPPVDRDAVARLLVAQLRDDKSSGEGVAMGALMWMRAGVRCLDRYRVKLVHDSSGVDF